MVGDLVDAVLIGADTPGHLAVAFHLDDDRLGHVGIGHHPLEHFHAQIDQPARHDSRPYFPSQPPSAFVPMKMSPPAVTTGPLRCTRCALPVFVMPFSTSARTLPSGARHLIVPSFRS